MTMIDSYINLDYFDSSHQGHMFLAALNGDIKDDDWIYNISVKEPMTKLKEAFINYKPFSKSVIFGSANGSSMKMYDLGIVHISL